MSRPRRKTVGISPEQFEAEIESLLLRVGIGLPGFQVQRLERIKTADGVYEIDVTARFEVLGGSFLVLIECKYHKNPIKREVVQVLYDRIRAVGAHKGMIFSTAKFQRGAIEFARAHKIALIQIDMVDRSRLPVQDSIVDARTSPFRQFLSPACVNTGSFLDSELRPTHLPMLNRDPNRNE